MCSFFVAETPLKNLFDVIAVFTAQSTNPNVGLGFRQRLLRAFSLVHGTVWGVGYIKFSVFGLLYMSLEVKAYHQIKIMRHNVSLKFSYDLRRWGHERIERFRTLGMHRAIGRDY